MRHLRSLRLLISCLLWLGAAVQAVTPPGLDSPQPVGAYFNGVFPATTPGDPSGWAVENAFPNLTFTDPMMLAEIPGANQFLVVGKTGLMWRFPKSASATMTQRVQVLDWTAKTETSEDQGFYSIAFHPKFGQAGQAGEKWVYVCYSRRAFAGVDDNDRTYWTVSRFTWVPASGTLDPNSESVLISQYDPHRYHNGGATFFGDDGFLYITVGDGGDGGDSFNNSQEINLGFFGGVLRIDVDNNPAKSHPIRRQPTENPLWEMNPKPAEWPASHSQGYGIPNDNPWLDPAGGILEEFYAIGLRSPHSAHFDPVTDDVWVGDVGQSNREELSRVRKGDNCQWAYKEGTRNTSKTKPSPYIGNETVPVHEYDHTVGASIIGGMRYRGTKWNAFLGGKVIFGDHMRGRIWSLELPAGGGSPIVTELYSTFHTGYKGGLCNFSTDSAGEIYMMDLAGSNNPGGKIMKLAVPAVSADPPQLLSQTGVFSDLVTLTPAPGVIPYDVPNPLWSDNAHKRRWLIVPNNGTHDSPAEDVMFSAEGNWLFPAGTVFVKHFEAPLDANNPAAVKRLETRFLICTSGGGKYGVTYKWNSAGTDAELMETGLEENYNFNTGSGSEPRTWTYPSRGDCMVCHNDVSGQALGLRTYHLNSDAYYPSTGRVANQLETLNALGMFDTTLTASQLEDYIEARALDDATAPLEHRVRSYLDTNCSHCHQPGAQGAGFDARLGTPLDAQNLINAIPTRYEELGPEGRYIKPGNPSLSAVHVRASAVGNGDAMPPLAKNLAHAQGVAALTAYIQGLVPAQFESPPAPMARFVRLTSLSGINNRKYAAVCELMILDGEGAPIPPGELSIEDVDSEAGSSSLATEAIDGITTSTANFWQTPNDGISNHPHHLTIDLGSLRGIGGFIYVPRQGTSTSSANGRIKDYQVHYSTDGTTWTLLTAGEWTNTTDWQTYAPGFNKRPARCQIAGPVAPMQGAFEVTMVFDMNVTDFTAADLQVTGGSVTRLRGDSYYYVARISPAPGSLEVQVSVPANAVNPEGKGSFASAVLPVTVIPDTQAPSAPGDLGAVPSVLAMQLSWTASTDNVDVTSYRLLRDGQEIATVSATSYADSGLDPDTKYDYQVIALDAMGNASTPALLTASTLPDTSAPSVPTSAGATPELFAVQLSWGPSSDNVGVTGYRIRRNNSVIATVTGLSFSDTDLECATNYSYKISAIDAADNESAPAMIDVTTLPDTVLPSVPDELAATPGLTTVALSWTASTDNDEITGYQITRNQVVIATVSGLSYADSGLQVGTSYTYEVRALDPSGNASLPASLATATLPDESPPSPPGNLAGTPGLFSMALTWTAAADNVAVDRYRIRRNGVVIGTVEELSFHDTGLQSGIEYHYEVVAIDVADQLSTPALLSISTLSDVEAPTAPGSLAGEPDFYSVALTWTASGDNIGVAGYQVRRDGALLGTVASPGFTDDQLAGGLAYHYEVKAIDVAGNLSAAATVTVSTLGFEAWLDAQGLSGQTTGDADHGGLDNRTEFQLGLDPHDPLDDLTFRLVCQAGGTDTTITFPELKPAGTYHLHAAAALEEILHPANRIITLTRTQIEAMTPAERSGYSVVLPTDANRSFFVLVFEPAAP